MMPWMAFHGYNNNQPVNVSQFDWGILAALGMHSYPSAQLAAQHPNSVSWFQVVSVNAAIDDANNARDLASAPGNAAKAAANAAKNIIPGLGGIGDFFQRLTEKATWERVGEVALGVIILYVGLKSIATPTGQQVSQTRTKDLIKNAGKRAVGVVK